MKCPKCGYLGFETVDRCRNCGYDFSLAPSGVEGRASSASSEVERLVSGSVERPIARQEAKLASNTDGTDGADERAQSPAEGLALSGVEGRAQPVVDELPASPSTPLGASELEHVPPGPSIPDLTLHDTPRVGNPLAEIELERKSALPTPAADPMVVHGKGSLDLDRIIGAPEERAAEAELDVKAPRPLGISDEHTPLLDAVEAEAAHLPLFGRGRMDQEAAESPIVAPPRPAGPPLAVRRATPEVARPRNRAPRTTRRDEPPLWFPLETSASPVGRDGVAENEALAPFHMASRPARLGAALIDAGLLAGICFSVLYLTLRIANLTFDDVGILPVVPMAAFLVLLIGGYLIAFTAAGGQTIGKMATGIKVIGEDGRPVDVSSAVLRLAGNAVNIATLGLAWLPAVFSADGRSLADRLAGTRVVRA